METVEAGSEYVRPGCSCAIASPPFEVEAFCEEWGRLVEISSKDEGGPAQAP